MLLQHVQDRRRQLSRCLLRRRGGRMNDGVARRIGLRHRPADTRGSRPTAAWGPPCMSSYQHDSSSPLNSLDAKSMGRKFLSKFNNAAAAGRMLWRVRVMTGMDQPVCAPLTLVQHRFCGGQARLPIWLRCAARLTRLLLSCRLRTLLICNAFECQ